MRARWMLTLLLLVGLAGPVLAYDELGCGALAPFDNLCEDGPGTATFPTPDLIFNAEGFTGTFHIRLHQQGQLRVEQQCDFVGGAEVGCSEQSGTLDSQVSTDLRCSVSPYAGSLSGPYGCWAFI